ncbi:hypothetical protein GCM10007874_37830 [Labrys miyagiensis]|uniref:Right handed beta helix domain-containing protein n=1 Tax=Labrys miyagiensis TaxID=346912 RepID=A0ABQ6CRD4_9HYPH|nr:right-handed parallel beta-helix repeat-containing protein [Labrys miyagiensis]GLS20766.1 hypothetical protein GCM10007874_37830 [Labrys miyagiensis]
MRVVTVTPATIGAVIAGVKPGDIVELEPGLYSRPFSLTNLRGEPGRPITLRGTSWAVIDGGRMAEEYRIEANYRARQVQLEGKYPGLWPYMGEAMIALQGCSHIVLEDLTIRRCWPTAIHLGDSQDIIIRRTDITDGTFAIAASGASTQGIVIDSVRWCQDVTRNRIWRSAAWMSVHGDQDVDIANDWRLYDGDFFRSESIRGGVTISHCQVEHAFNAVHGFNPGKDASLNTNFCVRDCSFSYVRDNVFEPEDCAINWWFHRNRLYNVHKWCSIEAQFSAYIYIFANLSWFDEIPGRHGQGNRTGGMFKLGPKQDKGAGPHYIFNNSFAARSDYAPAGVLRGLRHWANAVRFCQAGEGVCDGKTTFFGDLKKKASETGDRFTNNWKGNDIDFADDVIAHPQYTAVLKRNHYGPFRDSLAADPGFRDAGWPGQGGAGLMLAAGSPCRGRAPEQTVMLPDGGMALLPAGRDVGAFQGEELMRWREFVPYAPPTV